MRDFITTETRPDADHHEPTYVVFDTRNCYAPHRCDCGTKYDTVSIVEPLPSDFYLTYAEASGLCQGLRSDGTKAYFDVCGQWKAH